MSAPPLWLRWVLAIVIAAAVIAGIVIATDHAGPEGSGSEAGAEAEINRIADVTITEDEAPHFATLAVSAAPTAALQRAIASDVRRRIADHQLTGPLQGVSCTPGHSAAAARQAYHCTAHSDGIAYPFDAVVVARKRQLAWCKIDPQPTGEAGPEIPISASCRA
jgi:hypothetical protein